MIPQTARLLLVEDNPNDVRLALHALARAAPGCSVQAVADGAEALDVCFRDGRWRDCPADVPRIVLLDLKLPKVDGLEVLRRLKSDERTRTIPVVMLTSSREERDVRNCYETGANGYVVKPIDFDDFTRTMRLIGEFWLRVNEPPVRTTDPGTAPP